MLKRYTFFCLVVILLFSIYSYLLDQVYYRIEYGTAEQYRHNVGDYMVSFVFFSFPFSILIPVGYNYVVNKWISIIPYSTLLRFLFGASCGLLIGYLVQRRVVSYYIGPLRAQKNLYLFPMVGISVEIIRNMKMFFQRKEDPLEKRR